MLLTQDKIVSKLKNHFAEFFSNKGMMPKRGNLEVVGAFWNDTIYVELEKKVLKFYTSDDKRVLKGCLNFELYSVICERINSWKG